MQLNAGKDIISLDTVMGEMRLLPDALEVPIPVCFLQDTLEVRPQACGGVNRQTPDLRCSTTVPYLHFAAFLSAAATSHEAYRACRAANASCILWWHASTELSCISM